MLSAAARTCRICLHTFKTLRFSSKHISICTRCTNTLNQTPEPALAAETRLAEMLSRGIQRNAVNDLTAPEEWRRRRAHDALADLDRAVAHALTAWINRLLADAKNSTRDFKLMRAHRRGLLRMEGFASYPSTAVWLALASKVRLRDRKRCQSCGIADTTLDVHHIVYLSNHGTNRQDNLVTLCRTCHEDEHGRIFDWAEKELRNG